MTEPTLAAKVVAVDRALAAIPHAFGGALALAYYAEPRATIDIDLNLFVGTDRFDEVARALEPLGVVTDDPAVAELVGRDGQARVWWGRTPIDLFFAYDAFHAAAASRRRLAPFGDTTIPVLAAEDLVVCKVVFDRGKDWVDIEAMLELGTPLDSAEILKWVGRIAGDEDPRFARIIAVLTR